MNSMQETRAFLESIGQPGGDLYSLPNSEKTFDDGCQYRFEVPGIQGPGTTKTLLEEIERLEFYLHRITQTQGIYLLSDADIEAMVGLAQKHQVELILSIGPRATTDTSASVMSPEGMRMGYRLRGQDQVVRAIEDIRRAARLGCRGFLVYDEGCLWALNKARAAGLIPADSKFKVSAHTGHGNPCSAKLMEELGADSFNIVRDYQLQHLAAVRAAINIPLDCHTENPESSGGFIRHYEVPEMIRVAAPIYLKTGGSVAKTHSWDTTDADAKKRAKQVMLVRRVINEYYPEAKYSPKGSINH